jgi:hypothetical protein
VIERIPTWLLLLLVFSPWAIFGQEPEPSQATGMALVRCILGKFLGVVFHCFPPYVLHFFFKTPLLVLWLRLLFYTLILVRLLFLLLLLLLLMSGYVWNLILVSHIKLAWHLVWLVCQLRGKVCGCHLQFLSLKKRGRPLVLSSKLCILFLL